MWSVAHLKTYIPTLIFMIALAFVLRKFLLNKSEFIRFIPVTVIAVILLGLEVGKQVVSLNEGYNLYYLPFHFCSMFLFFIPLSAFYRGIGRERLVSFTMTTTATLFVFMLLCPNYAYADERIASFFTDYISFHTVVFHALVVFVFILFVALDLYKPNFKFDISNILIFLSIFCAVGGTMAQVFEKNYNNFYYCSVEAVENIRLTMVEVYGEAKGQAFYVLSASCINFIFVYLSYFACVFSYGFIKSRFLTKKDESIEAQKS